MFDNFEVIKDANLSKFSTIKIGGKARFVIFPKTAYELKKILKIAEKSEIKTQIIGNGSNILFDDNGFDGAIINLKHFNKIAIYGEYAIVGAGVNLFKLNTELKNNGLSGLEWSFGIPATIGGFVFMNGGSFGHEICEFIDEIKVLKNDKIITLRRKKIDFGYRFSNIDGIILQTKLRLKKDDCEKIEKRMFEVLNKKRMTQPCDKPSLGSVFKRVLAGNGSVLPAKLIDKLGLKGVKIGGIEVSQKHAGFFVNNGGGTAKDFIELLNLVKQKLFEFGVCLESEIIYLVKEKDDG